jgi:hypothetical protein
MRKIVAAAGRLRLIDEWRTEIWRLWSCRVALFWAAVSGIAAGWSALAGEIPTWIYMGGSVLLPVTMLAARLLKQTEAE